MKSFRLPSCKQKCQYALNRLFTVNYSGCSVYIVKDLVFCWVEAMDSINARIQLSEIPAMGAAFEGQLFTLPNESSDKYCNLRVYTRLVMFIFEEV